VDYRLLPGSLTDVAPSQHDPSCMLTRSAVDSIGPGHGGFRRPPFDERWRWSRPGDMAGTRSMRITGQGRLRG
jgi:hypothetical protein